MSLPEVLADGGVLVVSDDPQVRDGGLFGFPTDIELRLAVEGRDAWSLMEGWIPGLVIVDIQTGSSGGFALSKEMSNSTRLKDVPILMLLEREQDKWLAGSAGARSSMVKPIEADRLTRVALELLDEPAT